MAADGDMEQAVVLGRRIADPDQQARAMLELAQILVFDNVHVGAGHRDAVTVQIGDLSASDCQSLVMAEGLRLTTWEDCLETLVELVPAAAAVALRELESLGW